MVSVSQRAGRHPAAATGRALLTCRREEGSGQVMGVREAWEDSWSWGSTEQVQLPIHVELVRIQLHLLRCRGGGESEERETDKGN